MSSAQNNAHCDYYLQYLGKADNEEGKTDDVLNKQWYRQTSHVWRTVAVLLTIRYLFEAEERGAWGRGDVEGKVMSLEWRVIWEDALELLRDLVRETRGCGMTFASQSPEDEGGWKAKNRIRARAHVCLCKVHYRAQFGLCSAWESPEEQTRTRRDRKWEEREDEGGNEKFFPREVLIGVLSRGFEFVIRVLTWHMWIFLHYRQAVIY